MNYPKRSDLVYDEHGRYDPTREAAWNQALTVFYSHQPTHPRLGEWPDKPPGTYAIAHAGQSYLREWDPAIHPSKQQIEAECGQWASQEEKRKQAEDSARVQADILRAETRTEMQAERDAIGGLAGRLLTNSALRDVQVKLYERLLSLEARLSQLEGSG